jgi:hypothetical protein
VIRASLFSPLCQGHAPGVLACVVLGISGGFVPQPLGAKPPQSNTAGQGTGQQASGQASSHDRDVTVTGKRPITIGGTPPACTTGQGTGTADCAAHTLDSAAKLAQAQASGDPTLGVPHAGSADTTVGVGSLTASSQRLGADLRNRTTLPKRPTLPPPPPSPFARMP